MDNHFVLGKILVKYRPRFVILYDASLTFVRQLEVERIDKNPFSSDDSLSLKGF